MTDSAIVAVIAAGLVLLLLGLRRPRCGAAVLLIAAALAGGAGSGDE